jgi:hypothetical protein
MKTIKTILPTRTKWILSISAIIAIASLICYTALAQAKRSDAPHRSDNAAAGASSDQIPDLLPEPPDNESNPDFVKGRREWMDRFFGLGLGVSSSTYAKALGEARSMPLAPFVQTWSFQALSPMWNDWGGLGGSCTIPYPNPDQSYCGSSARIDAIAVDPVAPNGDVVYVGSEGGISKSTDRGLHWSYISDNGIPSQSIRSLAVDPVSSNIVYAGTGTNPRFGVGLYRSTNSGATWKIDLGISQFSGKTVGKIAIDPRTAGSATSTTLYASVTDGSHTIWKSTNSGINWTQIRGPTANAGNFYDIVIDPATAPSTVYITAPDGVFSGTGNGIWSASIHPIPQPSAHSYLALVNSVLYLAFKASDGSTSIEKRTNPGFSWTPLPAPCVPQPPPDPPFCAGLDCFGVNPVNSNQIFVGGGIDLVYSLDGGNTWIRSHEVHVDMHSIAFCPTNAQRNYLGTDGGIYRADYTGGSEITWYSKNQNLAGSLMYALSISGDDHIVMGNQDNGTQLGWVGRNPSWQRIYGGDGWKPKIDQNDSSKLYYVYYTGADPTCFGDNLRRIKSDSRAPYRWVNGVETNVTPVGAYCERTSFFPAMFVAPSDWNRVIMGFQNVWRSINSGNSWLRIGGGPNGFDTGTATVLNEAPSDTNVIYAVFDASRMWVTSNANQGNSATWTNRTTGLGGGIQAVTVHPTNPQTAYVACNSANSGLYKTTNMGITWTQLSFANLGCWDLAIDPVNPLHVFAATGSGVYASTDGGTTWGLTLGIPSGMAVTSLSLNAASRHLAASTYGRGAYILDLGEVRQAEAGVLTGCYIQADPNASGGYRVDGISSAGDNVAFNSFPQTTQITIRYASPNTGTFGLYVNGTRVASIPITATGPPPVGWTIFTETIVNAAIPANATVKLQYDTGDVGINLDYIIIAR